MMESEDETTRESSEFYLKNTPPSANGMVADDLFGFGRKSGSMVFLSLLGDKMRENGMDEESIAELFTFVGSPNFRSEELENKKMDVDSLVRRYQVASGGEGNDEEDAASYE